MPDITISITDTEQKALEYVMVDISDWTDNAVTNRARIAKEEIINLLVELRNSARLNKDFATSDRIRDQLLELGIQLKDSQEGTHFTIN